MSYLELRGRIQRSLPVALAGLLVFTQTAAAQQAAAPAQAAPAEPQSQNPAPATVQPLAPLPVEQGLKIRVLAGSNESNDLSRRVMAPLVVQVVDRDERPVEGGEVVFRFPVSGPSATFAGEKPPKRRGPMPKGKRPRSTGWRTARLAGSRCTWLPATVIRLERPLCR